MPIPNTLKHKNNTVAFYVFYVFYVLCTQWSINIMLSILTIDNFLSESESKQPENKSRV